MSFNYSKPILLVTSVIFIFSFLLFSFTLGQSNGVHPVRSSKSQGIGLYEIKKVFQQLSSLLIIKPVRATSNGVQQEVADRERQIQELERQKAEYQEQIKEKQREVRTFESEVFILDTEIKQIQLEIRAIDLVIQEVTLGIEQTSVEIEGAEAKTERLKKSLAEFLRILNQKDQESLLTILLKNREISDFFGNLESLKVSQQKAQVTIAELKQLKTELEEKQEELEVKKEGQFNLRRIQEIQQNEVAVKKNEVDTLLRVTRGDERRFQQLVQETERDIEILREQISFLLAQGITLEEAIRYGHLAAISTGIRPAFLLAILETESKLGANVGRCYIADATSGTSYVISDSARRFARGIHPTRDLPPFVKITEELGKDPFQTPISCWPGYGWGGAMGPAQFIPSTWVLVDDQVSSITGRKPADPWNIEDAFTASAILLAQGGATGQTVLAEEGAAMAYFSGDPRCNTNPRKSLSIRWQCANYANLVIANATKIEAQLPANLSTN